MTGPNADNLSLPGRSRRITVLPIEVPKPAEPPEPEPLESPAEPFEHPTPAEPLPEEPGGPEPVPSEPDRQPEKVPA